MKAQKRVSSQPRRVAQGELWQWRPRFSAPLRFLLEQLEASCPARERGNVSSKFPLPELQRKFRWRKSCLFLSFSTFHFNPRRGKNQVMSFRNFFSPKNCCVLRKSLIFPISNHSQSWDFFHFASDKRSDESQLWVIHFSMFYMLSFFSCCINSILNLYPKS